MPKIPALNPLLQAWLLEGPLSAQVPAYVERLQRGRYATHTSGRCLNGVAHFAHWMSMCYLPARTLDEGCIDQFLRYHLPRCDCLGGALRTPMELHAALMPVLEILRAQGVTACAPAPTGRSPMNSVTTTRTCAALGAWPTEPGAGTCALSSGYWCPSSLGGQSR